jgi:hypothetical protein
MNQLQTVDASTLSVADVTSVFTALAPVLIQSSNDVLTVEMPWIGKQTIGRDRALSLLIECSARVGLYETQQLVKSTFPNEHTKAAPIKTLSLMLPKKRKLEAIKPSDSSSNSSSESSDESESEPDCRNTTPSLAVNLGRTPGETLTDLMEAGLLFEGDVISLRAHTATIDNRGYIVADGTTFETNCPTAWYAFCCRNKDGKRPKIGAWNAKIKRGIRTLSLRSLLAQYRKMQTQL